MEKEFTISEELNSFRLDKVLTILLEGISRTTATKMIDDSLVFVNGKNEKSSYKVRTGDVLIVEELETKELVIKKEDIPLDIVYEDSDILIINKPQGMVVHPANGHWEGTLVNAIMHHCDDLSGINGVIRPGIVHRIDKDTSGLICVAKNDEAHNFLAEQLKDHTMNREYYALVKGLIKENSGEINMPIARSKFDRKKMAVDKENGKYSLTYFKVIQRFANHTLIQCKLSTGRTHQIRVHMAYIGHPIEGDTVYGTRSNKVYKNGQLLTAYKLSLIHPRSKELMTFEIELPDYFKEIIEKL